MNASYVWSKAMDQVDTDTTAIGYYLDRRRDWGPAGFDRTHVFNLDYVYLLPDFGTMEYHRAKEAIAEGRVAVERMMPLIEQVIR